MSIDKRIDDLISALDRNTAALQAAAGAVTSGNAAPTDKTEKTTRKGGSTKSEPTITQEQVNAALIKLKDDFDMSHAKAIIKEVGKVDKMGDIKPAQFQAVYDAAVAKHAELSNEGGGIDDL